MPFPIQQLIEGCSPLITVSPDQSVETALSLMIKHDFSQLPIVDGEKRVQGIVTSNTILRGLHFTKTTIDKLHVIDIKTDAPICLRDDDIFDVLERMRNNYSCLVVDNEKRLIGIITDFDTSDYFRSRAENIMLVEDIERTLKDFIMFAYPRATNGTDHPDLAAAVQQAVAPPHEFTQFKQALAKYVKAILPDAKNFDVKHAQAAFAEFTAHNIDIKSFEDLTLGEYIALFLHGNRWEHFKTAILLDKKAIQQVLDSVRVIRNKLAHFSGQVSAMEQEQLRYCLQWLQNHQSGIYRAFPNAETEPERHVFSTPNELEKDEFNALRLPGDSRYAPLAHFLKQKSTSDDKFVVLTFTDIETIIGAVLPPYARRHRSWWANDNISRVQSKQWLNAGWRVKYVNMAIEQVVFEFIGQKMPMNHTDAKVKATKQLPPVH